MLSEVLATKSMQSSVKLSASSQRKTGSAARQSRLPCTSRRRRMLRFRYSITSDTVQDRTLSLASQSIRSRVGTHTGGDMSGIIGQILSGLAGQRDGEQSPIIGMLQRTLEANGGISGL